MRQQQIVFVQRSDHWNWHVKKIKIIKMYRNQENGRIENIILVIIQAFTTNFRRFNYCQATNLQTRSLTACSFNYPVHRLYNW